MGTYGATWEARGYCGQGSVKELIGSLAGRSAIVAGGAAGVFDEVRAAEAVLSDPVIFAANEVGMFLPKLDHWFSQHPDNLWAWKTVRWLHPREREYTKYHSDCPRASLDYYWKQLTPMFALSGYTAMQIAWIMGAERIVLCGCPGSRARRFFEATPREREGDVFGYGVGATDADRNIQEQVEREMARLPEFKAAVRSMSGWTREFFGSLEGVNDGELCGHTSGVHSR